MKKMKRSILPAVVTAVLLACCLQGCKESIQAKPSSLKGDELVIASALRAHMRNHADRTGYDYKYIFITVLGKDPDREFLDYFSDIFAGVQPGSKMKTSRYGYENLPETRGVWVQYQVTDFRRISDGEALVSIATFEYESEGPDIQYVLRKKNGRWEAAGISAIEKGPILQSP